MEIFERIESFFTRLKAYAEVPIIGTIKDVVLKIMVEVLVIFAILAEEIKEGKRRKSQSIVDLTSSVADRDTVPRRYLENYLQRLIERADIDGALKNLQRLTDEEFMMAIVQVWRVVNYI